MKKRLKKTKTYSVESPDVINTINQTGFLMRFGYVNRPLACGQCKKCGNLNCLCPTAVDIAYIHRMMQFRCSQDYN